MKISIYIVLIASILISGCLFSSGDKTSSPSTSPTTSPVSIPTTPTYSNLIESGTVKIIVEGELASASVVLENKSITTATVVLMDDNSISTSLNYISSKESYVGILKGTSTGDIFIVTLTISGTDYTGVIIASK